MSAESAKLLAQATTPRPGACGRSMLRPYRPLREALNRFVWIYCFLSFMDLRLKILLTPHWTAQALEHNHRELLAFQYTNNEQSRVLQFYIPEFFVLVYGMSVEHAYILQRFIFVWFAFVLFHVYLRKWFSKELSFAGVCLLAAILPFTFAFGNDLQESAPFLMASFIAGLLTIRDGPAWGFALVLLLGSLNNETSLALPLVFFIYGIKQWKPREIWKRGWQTVAVSLPAFAYTAWIRYLTRDRPHLGGKWHWDENLLMMHWNLKFNLLDYWQADYLAIFFIFNVLWVYACLHWSKKPSFIQATLPLIPVFIVAHLITGVISEVRQMIPLAYVIIPAAFFTMFPPLESTQNSNVLSAQPTMPG